MIYTQRRAFLDQLAADLAGREIVTTRSRRTGSRSIRALPPTLPPAISTAQGVITTTEPLGSRSFFCLRAGRVSNGKRKSDGLERYTKEGRRGRAACRVAL